MPLKRLVPELPRRRTIGLVLMIIVVILSTIWALTPETPDLTPTEQTLVGKWGRPERDPLVAFRTRDRGLVLHPWLVQELARDRTYRQWVISGDDTSHAFVQVEGRWEVAGDKIRFEPGQSGMRRPLDVARTRLAKATGLPVAPTSSLLGAYHEIPYRLAGPDDLELNFRNQDRPSWKRLPRPIPVRLDDDMAKPAHGDGGDVSESK